MLELLMSKGFNLNEYPEGSFYEFETTDQEVISRVMQNDFYESDSKLTMQITENLDRPIIMVDCSVWGVSDDEFIEAVEKI